MMNSLLPLTVGLMAAFFPQTHIPNAKVATEGDATYACSDLTWPSPAAIQSNGDLQGTATVTCSFQALSGGGYPELENYLLAQLKQEATTIHSGPTAGTYQGLPSQAYDFDMNLTFSGTTVDAHENGTLATDTQSRLVLLMNTLSITGSEYDQYLKALNLSVDVTPVSGQSGSYQGAITMSIDMSKPWYAPTSVFESDVVKTVQDSVTSYESTVVTEVQNNI